VLTLASQLLNSLAMAPVNVTGAMAALQQATPARPDTGLVRPPIPDPLVPVVQWIFQRPGWMMISGLVLAVIVALAVLYFAWRHRRDILTWLTTRSRGTKLAMAGTVGILLLLVAGVGAKAYVYMEDDNNFCRGCHIFVPAGQPFVHPDTGTYLLVNALEGKHDTLRCHDCHTPDMKAQMIELALWMVDRPDKVPPHEKVARDVCESCHVKGKAKEKWEAIALTAGHRTHLESDSVALKDVECLSCHARSAHRFLPPDSTCAQKGCHLTDDVKINLGGMADQTGLHCNVCHQFTKEVPRFATRDSAAGTLRPGSGECFSCHQMKERLAEFDEARDPHGGTCGMCHNPHINVKPEDAIKSCATAACHGDWREVPFHSGAAHRKAAPQCETCHLPHTARVDASDCIGCHERGGGPGKSKARPPVPFDTLKALRSVSGLPEPAAPRGKGDAPPDELSPAALFSPAEADTFSHERHKKLPCLKCHLTSSQTSTLTFRPPRGCQICHHEAPARNECAACHTASELTPMTLPVTVAVPKREARTRDVRFAHDRHTSLRCDECHREPVTLEPATETRTCVACHEKHHAVGRDCSVCHAEVATSGRTHAPPVAAHESCDACHTPARIAELTPARTFCLTCHQPKVKDHYSDRECSSCHLSASPEDWRSHLTRAGGS
jgi:hypothetical protein